MCLRLTGAYDGVQCEALAGGSERRWPAEQVLAEVGEEEAMSGDPTAGLEHVECALKEGWRGRGLGDGGECGAEGFGLQAETAEPELAALIRRRWWQCGFERLGVEQARDEEKGDHGDGGTQVWQGEGGQQRDGAAAGGAEVAADADESIEVGVDDRARVEAVGFQRVFGLALRAVRGSIVVGAGLGGFGEVALHGAGEWV